MREGKASVGWIRFFWLHSSRIHFADTQQEGRPASAFRLRSVRTSTAWKQCPIKGGQFARRCCVGARRYAARGLYERRTAEACAVNTSLPAIVQEINGCLTGQHPVRSRGSAVAAAEGAAAKKVRLAGW